MNLGLREASGGSEQGLLKMAQKLTSNTALSLS